MMKCLRCGTDLKDSTVFCPDCSKVASVPLQTSVYLNRKIILPKRKPSQSVKKAESKTPARKQRRAGSWMVLCAILLLVIGALLIHGAYTYDQKKQLAQEVEQLHAFEDECVRLTNKLREAEAEVTSLEEELSRLGSSSYLAIREELKTVQAEKDALTRELSRAQSDLTELQGQLEQLIDKAEFLDDYIVFLQDG